MAISSTSYRGGLTSKIIAYIHANPGCNVPQVAEAVGTSPNSANVIITRIRERAYYKDKTILTYQKPDGLRFKKESE